MIHISAIHYMINFLPNLFRKAIRLVSQYECKKTNNISAVSQIYWCMEQLLNNTYFRKLL